MSIVAQNSTQSSDLLGASAAQAGKKAQESSAAQGHAAEARSQLNVSIVEASLEVSIQSQNAPLTLLLRSAIAGINDVLKPELGENAIENAAGQDNSAEATASRIVALSTGFFEAFKRQHPDESEAEVMAKFMTTIRSGFEQGYKEASDILQGLGVLGGDIAANIDKTHSLVQEGYARFEAGQAANFEAGQAANSANMEPMQSEKLAA